MKFPIRLDRYVSQATDWSRKHVKQLIKQGEVTVNQQPVTQADFKVDQTHSICASGEEITLPGPRYYMLNKPPGFICANKDREHLTVLELIDEPRKDDLSVAGRLDIDTTGLVLLSTDGQWIHQIISPKQACEKEYWVETLTPLNQKQIDKLERGVWLNQEKTRTAPARLETIDEYNYRLIITEGRYHQVKRMFAAIGNKVESLHRHRIGTITLDADLMPGEYRALTPNEYQL